jgi:hypothetical protein
MLSKYVYLLTPTVLLAACAHHAAVRVECDGPLRPINRPALGQSIPSPDASPSASDMVATPHQVQP